MSALGSPVQGTAKAPPQSSASQNTSVGGGSRPGTVKMPIESSAPADPRFIRGTPPGGWLK